MRRIVLLLALVLMALPAHAQSYSQAALKFGSMSNLSPAPTSGSITGPCDTGANWVQTGPITCNGCRLHFGGDVTINNTITVTAGVEDNAASQGDSFNNGVDTTIRSPGEGPGGGGGGYTYGASSHGGAGGGHGGAGGAGSSDGIPVGGNAYPLQYFLPGSGGGSTGGDGGGGLYIEARGNVTITSAAVIHADGAAATNSGGSGGGIDIRALGTINIQNGAVLTADGGSPSTSGGGGGGGIINIQAKGGVTNSTPGGNIHANGGTGHTHGGSAGIVTVGGNFTGPRINW